MYIILCMKSIYMKIAPVKAYICSKCGDDVGVTKATYERIKTFPKKEISAICNVCFEKQKDFKGVYIKPSPEQLDEISKYQENK